MALHACTLYLLSIGPQWGTFHGTEWNGCRMRLNDMWLVVTFHVIVSTDAS